MATSCCACACGIVVHYVHCVIGYATLAILHEKTQLPKFQCLLVRLNTLFFYLKPDRPMIMIAVIEFTDIRFCPGHLANQTLTRV